MNTSPRTLSDAIARVVREVGVERGVDLALHALFIRWITLDEYGEKLWKNLQESPDPETLNECFAQLAIYREEISIQFEDGLAVSRVLRQVLELITVATSDVAPEARRSFLRESYEAVVTRLDELGGQASESDTPRGLAELMVRLVVDPDDRVFDPACGNATSLLVAAESIPNVKVSGIEINRRIARRAGMRLIINSVDHMFGLSIRPGDAFQGAAANEYDAVILQPPWGLKLTQDQQQRVQQIVGVQPGPGGARTVKGDLGWLLLAYDTLVQDGRAAVLLTTSSLTPYARFVQRYLLDIGAVECVATLPGGVLGHTSVETALWVLRKLTTGSTKEPVLFVNTSTLFGAAYRGKVIVNDEAIEQIVGIVDLFRTTGDVRAPRHIAASIEQSGIDLQRGLSPQQFLDPPPTLTETHPSPKQALLTHVHLSNFKAFGRPTNIPLAPLTLLYGANSAGKSSIIQALLLLQQSKSDNHLVTQGATIGAGGFQGLVNGHRSEPVQLGLTYGARPAWLPQSGTPDPQMTRSALWTFEADGRGRGARTACHLQFGAYTMPFVVDPNQPELLELALDAASTVFTGVATGTLLYPFDARLITDGDEREQVERLRSRQNTANRAVKLLREAGNHGLVTRSATILQFDGLSSQFRPGETERDEGTVASYVKRTGQLASGLATELGHLFDSLVWLGPLRSAPKRFYDRANTNSEPGDGRHVAMYLFDHTSVTDQVNLWLKDLDIPYLLDVVPVAIGPTAHLTGDLVAISLTDTRSGVTITPADVGFGISQILPIVVELLARRESIIAIEQPETHLHPRLQARLADLFIDSVQAGGRANQLLVETHSEHLMLRVQRRIREGALDPALVSVIYVDQDRNGNATAQTLRLNAEGDFLDEWPNGFFDERLDEMFGTL
jgi:type I restriction-modification system DNA methylase subunit